MDCPTCRSPNPPEAAACRACGAPLAAGSGQSPQALPPGTSLQGGAFTVGPVLGQGGFGITYAGEDSRLGRAVAIKEYFPQGCARQGRLVHPGGIPPGDFGSARSRFLEE